MKTKYQRTKPDKVLMKTFVTNGDAPFTTAKAAIGFVIEIPYLVNKVNLEESRLQVLQFNERMAREYYVGSSIISSELEEGFQRLATAIKDQEKRVKLAKNDLGLMQISLRELKKIFSNEDVLEFQAFLTAEQPFLEKGDEPDQS